MDATVVAAITAAVAVILDREPGAVRIREVRPIGAAAGARFGPVAPALWSLAGRQAQMAARRLSLIRKEPAGR